MISLFRRRRQAPLAEGPPQRRTRTGWQTYTDPHLSCCTHCPDGCTWNGQHPGPCRHCIREMEATGPLPDCLTGYDGRCVTCEQLHGVHIVHGRRW